MSSQAIDFSKYEQAAPTTGQIDFSKYEQPSRSAASPIAPPALKVGAPSSEGMHPSFLLGDPDHDATPQPMGEVAKGMVRNVADVTAPVIAHRLGQKLAPDTIPKGDIYPNWLGKEGELKDVPEKATMMMLGGLEGPEAEAAASRIASPAEATGPSAISRVGSLAGSEIRSRVPFLSRSIAKPTIARPMPAPIPETNGIPWGSGGQGPLTLRGKLIPAEPGSEGGAVGEPGPTASPDQLTRIAPPNLRAPVTENPEVGNLTRAMQKSGVPMAERPSLLLKGSGRVNRILGPEEDLTDIMAKSVRLAKRQRGQ